MSDSSTGNVRYPPPAPPADLTAQEREILERVNQRVAAGRSLDEVMTFLFDATRPICPCDRMSVAMLDEDGERLVSYWDKAVYEPTYLKVGFVQELRDSSLRRIIEEGVPRVLDDLQAYGTARPASVSTELLLREGIRSSMTCPLSVDGRPIGVMFRSSRRPAAYGERHVRLHLAIAERLSQAVEKVYRIERLGAANRAYTEMLGFVSHELKGPLTTMLLTAEVIKQGMLGPLNDQQRDKIEQIVRQGKYLSGLIRDYLDLARIEEGGLVLRPRSDVGLVRDVVGPAIAIAIPWLEEWGVTLDREVPDPDATVECDDDLLKIAVVNLLNNAGKYGRRGGRAAIRARAEKGTFVVSVWNEGSGFREADGVMLFRKFSRLPTPEFKSVKGSGLGLYTAWRIVHLHHGRISGRSEYGRWAEFTVEIPQPLGT